MFSTISSARTVALCRTPPGRSPASSTAATRRAAVPRSAMLPVTTATPAAPGGHVRRSPPRRLGFGPRTPVENNHSGALGVHHCAKTKPRPPMPPTTMYPLSRRTSGSGGGAATASVLPPAGIEITIVPLCGPAAASSNAVPASGRANSVTGSWATRRRRYGAGSSAGAADSAPGQPQVQIEVDDGERGASGQRRQPQRRIGVDVLLAEFDEPAAGSEDLHTAPDSLTRQRVQHDVDAVAVGGGHDLIGEGRARRVAT